MKISQEYRQQLFDRQETTDDHLMHIIGVLDEKHSGIYFIVKNSWGEISPLKGYVYASEAYLRLNTLSFTLPKMALPVDIKRRLGLEQGQVNIEQKEEKELKPVKPAKISNESRRKPTESKDTLKPQPIKRPVDGGNN
ncbi:MAG: C1 family peptidase [Saprospiraceae bacterium]